jgi:hypothetical protein
VPLAIEQTFGYGNPMGAESLFEVTGSYCLDCQTPVSFMGIPSDATCPRCRLRMYLTEHGIGRYLRSGWSPGGIQGRRPAPSPRRPWHPARGPQELPQEGPPGQHQGAEQPELGRIQGQPV